MACSLQFYGDGISFWVIFGQSFYFRVFPGGTRITQPRWMLARGILGSGWICGVSFRHFPNSSSWWWLISSIFLIRISCHKTTHTDGYYGAWPGWVVSVSVLLDKSPVSGPGRGSLSFNSEIFKSMCTNNSKCTDFHHLILSS